MHRGIDLKSKPVQPLHPQVLRQRRADEFWQIDLCTTDGLSSCQGFSTLCQTLPGRLQTQDFFLLGSISLHGLRTTNLSGEFARYRSLPARATDQALSPRHSRPSLTQHSGPCKLGARLAHLRRLCASVDYPRPRALRGRQLRRGIGPDGLRARCHYHRFVSGTFPWAQFRKHKGAVKLHTLLDLRGNIPTVVIITHGKVHEVNILDQLSFEAGAFYIMDRGYLDFARLYKLHLASAFFVTRAKKRFDFQRLYSQPVDRATGVICDQIVTLVNPVPRQGYPEKLRRIRYRDALTDQRLVFLTNNFNLPPLTI